MPLAFWITRAAHRALDVLLVLLIGIVLGTLVLARAIPAITGGTALVVGGGSMEPAIPRGAAVVALPVSAADLAVGDVVSLRVGDRRAIFTHRITRLVTRDDGLWLATRGDANPDPDPSIVPATSVIGRVTVVVPLAGYVVMLLASLQGIAFLVSLGIVVLVGAWLLETLEADLGRALRRRAPAGLAAGAT